MWLSNSDPRITSGGLSERLTQMAKRKISPFMNFVPADYYKTVCDFYGVNVLKHPWTFISYDPSLDKRIPFMVYDFHIPTVNGWPVGFMQVKWKSIKSEYVIIKDIYLDNMSPTCQPPQLSSFHPDEA